MSSLHKIAHDPLVHFLAAGAVLLALFSLLNPSSDQQNGSKRIQVDEATLLSFIQYRTKIFDPDQARQRLESATAAELETLIADYVREEALHRQALELGLDQNDYVIRRRLVQKLEYIAAGSAKDVETPGRQDVEAFFNVHRADYQIDAALTFTQVFFSSQKRGEVEAENMALAKLAQLNRDRVQFIQATQHGELFPYHTNYVDRSPEYVASHFGWPMTRSLLALSPSGDEWRGPFKSEFGVHLILLTRYQPQRLPELDEVFEQVVSDMRRIQSDTLMEEAINGIVSKYEVQVTYPAVAP